MLVYCVLPSIDLSLSDATNVDVREDNLSVDSPRVNGTLVDGNLVDGTLVDGNNVDGNHVDGTLVDGTLVDGTLVDERYSAKFIYIYRRYSCESVLLHRISTTRFNYVRVHSYINGRCKNRLC